jgi:predicted ATPase/class 3 adenylate cyclase
MERVMTDLPSGTVTFLFTDIEGSTALWERDRAAMREAVARKLAILQSLIAAHHGVLYKTVGDGIQAAFASAEEALRAALASQRALLAEAWVEPPGPLRVRMALHAGEAAPDAHGDYLAAPLNRLSRLLAAGHGGQILLSQTAQQLTRGALPPGTELRDLGEHRLRDLLEPERVYQLLHPDVPHDFPPLRTLESRPNNLPRQPTPFLGREREITEIGALLRRDDVQLVTLTGPGGIGKTRLGLQVGLQLLDAFPDGVFLVELAPLVEPSFIPSAIAVELGVRDEKERPLLASLRAFLMHRTLLLLLDNVEHLLDAVPVVSELLAEAPGMKILATSRTPLHLRAEHEFPVPPFAVPDPTRLPSVEVISQSEAVRFFGQRAGAARPDFTITTDNAAQVAAICHRLDGLPLAIELAAARIKLLPPAALLARLERRLPLLTGGPKDLPQRQQTLRDAIAWSYDLLPASEQTLFRRLARFAGGCTLEAAEAVANPDGEMDLLEGLTALVDASLLRQTEASGEARFGMLETVREFGLEHLQESGEGDDIAQRHAAYYLAFAGLMGADTLLGDSDEALDRLTPDHDNLRLAFDWFCDVGAADESLRLAAACAPYWYARGHVREGWDRLHRALAMAPPSPTVAKGQVLNALGSMAIRMGNLPAASRYAQEAVALWNAIDDSQGRDSAVYVLAMVEENQAHWDTAAQLFDTLIASWRQQEESFHLGRALALRAGVAYGQGDLEQAVALGQEAAGLFRRLGNRRWTGLADWYLGLFALGQGQLPDAARYFQESLRALIVGGDAAWQFKPLAGLAVVAIEGQQPDVAARLLGAVDGLLDSTGASLLPFDIPLYERAETSTRAMLSESAFSANLAAGRDLAPDDWLAAVNDLTTGVEPAVLAAPEG